MSKNFLWQGLRRLTALFSMVFGRIAWHCPPWLAYVWQTHVTAPKRFFASLASLLVAVGVGLFSYHWYQQLPQPELVTAHLTAPQITPLAKVLVPDVLTVDFGSEKPVFTAKSVAPLGALGKTVTQEITVTPALVGQWVWQTDSQLVFTPAHDWPAGQTYTLHFSKKMFASGTKMAQLTYTFSTTPFKIHIAEFKLYQDPVDPTLRNAVATLQFNYPVHPESLDQHIALVPESGGRALPLTLTYDESKRTAYVRSAPLPLPPAAYYLTLALAKGIQAATGPSQSAKTIRQNILIPDTKRYFQVQHATTTIVRNAKNQPEQMLVLETTLGITQTALHQALHVYLLPEAYPASLTEAAKEHYHWHNPGEITPAILALATPISLQAIPADREYATLNSYAFQAAQGRYLYLKIDQGVEGFGHFPLAQDYGIVLRIPAYPKEISFLHPGALLALSGEKKLSVLLRGVPAVKFSIARVRPLDVNHLITQTEGDFSHPQFLNPNFTAANISEIFSDIQSFAATDLGQAQYTTIDVGKYLAHQSPAAGPLGLFLLQADGWDPQKKSPLAVHTERLVLVTDLGLWVKDNSDETHDVFVQSITQAAPVAKVRVDLLGKNGLPIATSTTDAAGHAHFPSVKDFTDEHEPTVYLATLDQDVTFIPYHRTDRQLNYSRFDIGGIVTSPEAQTLTAYLFSDRGIYRPGDTAHIGMIVKAAYVQPQPAGLPLEVTVIDARGVTVLDQPLTLDATGLFSLDFHTDLTAPTGQYTVNLSIVKDHHPSSLLGSTTLTVAEFQPDRMRISAAFSKPLSEGWISPTDLKANIHLWNLYGAPASARKISGKILLAPERIQFKDYPNTIFVDPLLDATKPPKVLTDTLPDVVTNDEGLAILDLNLARFDQATYRLTVYAEGFESAAGRSVATETHVLVSPLAFLVGYRAEGDLNYIQQNSERAVNFIAINPALKSQAVDQLHIQLQSLHPVTTLVKNPNGTYQYQSIIQTTLVKTDPFSIAADGTRYILPTQQIGDFVVSVLDSHQVALSRFQYTVAGSSALPLAKNAELTVKLNKAEYTADEDIQLQIIAPYTGGGLITIEKDKVYAYQWFKTAATHSLQTIHLPKTLQGNGYVTVTFMRDWNSPDIFTNPLSYSVVPFQVNHAAHQVHIDLTTPATAEPGMPFTMHYRSDRPSKMLIFAVDEGILQVGHYPVPDPLSFFFQKQALEVFTQQTIDQILPKFIAERELAAVGGDMSALAAKLTLNPFKRKTDLPVAYWSGIVDSDATDRQLTYPVPDYFNGTLHVMAVAVADDAVGHADQTAEIRGPFVINPNVPTVAAPHDEFEVSASVANNVKQSGLAKVVVELTTTPAITLLGPAQQTLTIAEGHEATVHYRLRANNILGSATVTFVARAADKTSQMTATLSVRPANPYVTTLLTGNTHDKSITLPLERALYPNYRNVDLVFSTNPLILVAGLQQYLDHFPFGCTEQLVSQTFPLLVLSNQPWFTPDVRLMTHKIEATIQQLGQRQMSSGGFSYWPTASDYSNNAFASIYAMHFLTEARGHGLTVPTDMFRAGISYLKEFVGQPASNLAEARLKAYAIYVLTRNEIVTTNYLTHLQDELHNIAQDHWKTDITSAYIAAAYQLMKSYPEANRLITAYQPGQPHAEVGDDFYQDATQDAEYLYLLARQFPDRLSTVGEPLIASLVNTMNTAEVNTLFSSVASLALSAYAESYQAFQPASLTAIASLRDGQEQSLTHQQTMYQKMNISEATKKIKINNPEKQHYFYQLTEAGFDQTVTTKASQHGMEIFRDYRDLTGHTITTATLGTEIEVHIEVRSRGADYLSNIAIVDLLPGGFEVIRDSVQPDNMDYVDVREDRVIFFGGIGTETKTLTYHIKATNVGEYAVPPIVASAMYHPGIQAEGSAGKMIVQE